jgi:RimJ/RimL family protein N-acetyltransferase
MPLPAALRTPRLLLRPWRDEDLAPFAAMGADPRVMEHFPARLTRAESDAQALLLRRQLEERGWGLWAVEAPGVAPFIGFTGLSVPRFHAPFTPCVEVGWRLAAEHWGQGYATEAARAAVAYAFGQLQLPALVSFTVPANARSRAVMERLGFTHRPDEDFEHPSLPEGHPLRRHVLYRLSRADWEAGPGGGGGGVQPSDGAPGGGRLDGMSLGLVYIPPPARAGPPPPGPQPAPRAPGGQSAAGAAPARWARGTSRTPAHRP